jgi:hypothetical protein
MGWLGYCIIHTGKCVVCKILVSSQNSCLVSRLKIHIKIRLLKRNTIAPIGTCCLSFLCSFLSWSTPTHQFTLSSVVGWVSIESTRSTATPSTSFDLFTTDFTSKYSYFRYFVVNWQHGLVHVGTESRPVSMCIRGKCWGNRVLRKSKPHHPQTCAHGM